MYLTTPLNHGILALYRQQQASTNGELPPDYDGIARHVGRNNEQMQAVTDTSGCANRQAFLSIRRPKARAPYSGLF